MVRAKWVISDTKIIETSRLSRNFHRRTTQRSVKCNGKTAYARGYLVGCFQWPFQNRCGMAMTIAANGNQFTWKKSALSPYLSCLVGVLDRILNCLKAKASWYFWQQSDDHRVAARSVTTFILSACVPNRRCVRAVLYLHRCAFRHCEVEELRVVYGPSRCWNFDHSHVVKCGF